MDLRADGDLLVVRAGARVPKVCVKCGATRDVSRRHQEFGVGQYGAGAGAAGGVLGAMVANVLRSSFRDQPGLQAAVLGTILVVVIAAAAIAQRATPKLALEVPLCADHHAQLDGALRNRTWLLLALGIAGVLAIFGIGVANMWLVGTAVALLFGAIGVAFAVGMPRAWIKARWAKDGHVALDVGPDLAKKIVARDERRRAAKKKGSAAADDASEAGEAGEASEPPDEASPAA